MRHRIRLGDTMSIPRMRESSVLGLFWSPASAGVRKTELTKRPENRFSRLPDSLFSPVETERAYVYPFEKGRSRRLSLG